MKVVFTSLGPDREYTTADEQKFKEKFTGRLEEITRSRGLFPGTASCLTGR